MRCRRCNGTTGLLVGDGEVVCWSCIYALGDVVANPEDQDDRVLTALLAQHGEHVRLERAKNRKLVWIA